MPLGGCFRINLDSSSLNEKVSKRTFFELIYDWLKKGYTKSEKKEPFEKFEKVTSYTSQVVLCLVNSM